MMAVEMAEDCSRAKLAARRRRAAWMRDFDLGKRSEERRRRMAPVPVASMAWMRK